MGTRNTVGTVRRRTCWGLTLFLALVLVAGSGLTAVAFAQTVTVRYWDFIDHKLDNPRSRALAQHIQRFEAANPGIKISAEIMPWHQVAPQLIQAAAAGRSEERRVGK